MGSQRRLYPLPWTGTVILAVVVNSHHRNRVIIFGIPKTLERTYKPQHRHPPEAHWYQNSVKDNQNTRPDINSRTGCLLEAFALLLHPATAYFAAGSA